MRASAVLRFAASMTGALECLLLSPSVDSQVPPGFWRGTGSVDRVSDLKWIALVVHYDSDFTFTTDAAGQADGTATVRYTFRVDDTRLRALVSNTSSYSNQAIALMPIGGVPIGSVLGMGMQFHELQGMAGSYDGGTVVRQGKIRGALVGSKLHLEWMTPPATMPYTITKVFTMKREAFKKDKSPAYSPWIVDALVAQPAKGHWEASVPVGASTKRTESSTWTVVWSAHQEPAEK